MLAKFKILAIGIIVLICVRAFALEPIYKGTFSAKASGGYDVVEYFKSAKPAKGLDKFKLKHENADWFFISQENLDEFKANPTKYAPQYGGYCAWAISQGYDASGDPLVWDMRDGKLYFNYDKEVQSKWQKDTAGFIAKANNNWPKLIAK